MERRKFFSDGELVDGLIRLAIEYEQTPSAYLLTIARGEGFDIASSALYHKRFGSFAMALEIAGFNVDRSVYANRHEERELILNSLYHLSEEIDYIPSLDELTAAAKQGRIPHVSTLRKKFGDIPTAYEMAGIYDQNSQRTLNLLAYSGEVDDIIESPILHKSFVAWLNSKQIALGIANIAYKASTGEGSLLARRNCGIKMLVDPNCLHMARVEQIETTHARIEVPDYSIVLPLTGDADPYHKLVDRKRPIKFSYRDEYGHQVVKKSPVRKRRLSGLIVAQLRRFAVDLMAE